MTVKQRDAYITALTDTLQFLQLQEGKSHQSYYSTGWAGMTLLELLQELKKGEIFEHDSQTKI